MSNDSNKKNTRKKKTQKKSFKNNKQFRIACLVISLILGFTAILFDAFLLYVNILPIKYLIPLLIILSLFEFLFIYILIKRKFKLWVKGVSIFFSMIFSIIFIMACIYIGKTYDFMGKIKSKNVLTEEYYIMVNKDSHIEKIEELNSKTIGTFDENVDIYNEAISELQKMGNYNMEKSDSVQSMIDSLMDNEVDAIMISAVHKQMMSEEIEDFDDKTKIIYTISVEIKKQTEVKKTELSVTREAFTIYVSGIDTYGKISSRSRSDVNMLVTVNPKTHQILLTSIPRDYYVQLHGTAGYKDKLTHAGIYGIDMSVTTLEDLLDINIDYYVRVNFSTLIKIVDVLGGIDVYSDKAFTPWTNRSIYIPKGNVHMDGAMALAFARERKTYLEGDRHRVKNQQDVISAIIKKVTSSTTILTKYTTLLDQLSSSFETNIDPNAITDLIKMQLDKMPSWKIEQYSLNGSDAMEYTYSYGNQKLYVMIPNQATVSKAKQYINDMESGKVITISEEDKFVAGNSEGINAIPSTPTNEDDDNEENNQPDNDSNQNIEETPSDTPTNNEENNTTNTEEPTNNQNTEENIQDSSSSENDSSTNNESSNSNEPENEENNSSTTNESENKEEDSSITNENQNNNEEI